MKITYAKVMSFDQEGELVERFLEIFPKGEIVANRATCAENVNFPWHAFRDMLPQPLRERYRVARNALVAERDAARETTRASAAQVEYAPSRDGREGLENEFSYHYQLTPAQQAEEAVNAAYRQKFAALFGEFAGKIP